MKDIPAAYQDTATCSIATQLIPSPRGKGSFTAEAREICLLNATCAERPARGSKTAQGVCVCECALFHWSVFLGLVAPRTGRGRFSGESCLIWGTVKRFQTQCYKDKRREQRMYVCTRKCLSWWKRLAVNKCSLIYHPPQIFIPPPKQHGKSSLCCYSLNRLIQASTAPCVTRTATFHITYRIVITAIWCILTLWLTKNTLSP